jgi:hypothetical protein
LTPIFFTDRDLGKSVPDIIRKAGINVVKHSDHFPDDAKDQDWLLEVGQKGWFCLTHDKRIRYKPNEKDAVMRAGVGLFILVGHAPHDELANNFVNTLSKIERFIGKHDPPFIAKIYRAPKKFRSFGKKPGSVKLSLSHKEWLRSQK